MRRGLLGAAVAAGFLVATAAVAKIAEIRPIEERWLRVDAVVVTAPIREGFAFYGIGGVTIQTLAVDRVLHGDAELGAGTVSIGVDEVGLPLYQLAAGRRYILELEGVDADTGRRQVVGATEASAEWIERYRRWFETVPPWSEPIDGLVVRASPSQSSFDGDADLDVFLAIRNVSEQPRRLELASSSFVVLDIVDPSGERVDAVAHPHLTSDEIREFFARRAKSRVLALEPGRTHVIWVRRVNSAEKGWGYKEQLGFRYYPLTRAGRYSVQIQTRGFYVRTLTAAPFEITLQP